MHAADPSQTEKVADYTLLRRLGSGATGEVWLGQHVFTRSYAAVKLLRAQARSPERVMRLFERERRAICRLSHPHIVPLFDVGPTFLVTAYIDGTDLARRLRTPIDPAAAVHVTLQIASALAHAHAFGVIHRDVKPSNILIDQAGNAFLADFGLALLPEELDELGPTSRVGTLQFMAPEQMRGELVGPESDQYALGRTLLEMLVGGTLPREADRALAELPPELPAGLREAVARATDPDRSQRFGSMEALSDALRAVDLRAYPPPRRLAPEVRVRAPYRWVTGGGTSAEVGPDLERVDYRLSELAAAGLVDDAAMARFRAETGYADLGWSVYGNRARLGPLSDPAAMARATDVVVLVHGVLCTRAVWADAGAAICRDSAQSVVLAIDAFGFGQSRFVQVPPDPEHAHPRALPRMLTAWLALLGLAELPTVLVGHSLAGTSLLTVSDEDVGGRVARIAITPVFPFADGFYRGKMKTVVAMMRSLGRVPSVHRMMGRVMMRGPEVKMYTAKARQILWEQFAQTPVLQLTRVFEEFLTCVPATGDRLQRCLILVAQDDPIAPPKQIAAALTRLGFPSSHVRHLVGSGHFPQAEQSAHPEWTQRNMVDVVGTIVSLLRSSSEGAPPSTAVASTIVGSTTT